MKIFRFEKIDGSNLIKSGFQFCSEYITAQKDFTLENNIKDAILKINNVNADTIKGFINHKAVGYCLESEKWSIAVGDLLSGKTYKIKLQLVPNTFNVYGPHRYIGADMPLVSPSQFEGIKNFADSIDSPENTLTDEYKFIKFYLEGDISIKIIK